MKKYETPEYEIEKFTIESIMTDSGLNGDGNNQIDGGDGFDFQLKKQEIFSCFFFLLLIDFT